MAIGKSCDFLSDMRRIIHFSWQDILFYCLKKVKGLNQTVHTLCNPLPNVNNSISSFTAISLCPQSTCQRTSRWQHQTTGRHEHVDRRITRRSFPNLYPRSENIWRKTSESASGKFFIYANAYVTATSNRTWPLCTHLYIPRFTQLLFRCLS